MTELQKDNSSNSPVAVIVLGAGKGTRMKSGLPKVLHRIAGQTMIRHVLDSVETVGPEKVVVVIGPELENLESNFRPHTVVVQEKRLGTAHAVLQARDELEGFKGDIVVVFGDTPLLTSDTICCLQKQLGGSDQTSLAILGFHMDDPTGYGRIRCTNDGDVQSIVEELDASAEELGITLCNSGAMAFKSEVLFQNLDAIESKNAKDEYYLTDLVSIIHGSGKKVIMVTGRAEELQGINSRADLAKAESVMQNRLRMRAMNAGVTLIDPCSTWLSMDTRFGIDVIVGPNVYFGDSVEVGDGVEVKAFSHLEGVRLAQGSIVGPFARLRPGTVIGVGAKIGNFVEVKAAQVGDGSKISHLSYIGDADIGDGANIGAGTITCNYDGVEKHQTTVGNGAFIGSNSALVAPVVVGDRAMIGAGSVVTDNVDADELSVTRAVQKHLKGGAKRWRNRRSKEKF